MREAPEQPADAGPVVQQGVRPLADRLRIADEACAEDGERPIDAECARRAMDFAARHCDPSGVTSDGRGNVCFSWGRPLAMRWMPNGETHWAGWVDGRLRWGYGEPDVALFPCLRPNVRAEPQLAAQRSDEDGTT